MKDDFSEFLKLNVTEYNTHVRLYGSIGSNRIKKMINGEMQPNERKEPERKLSYDTLTKDFTATSKNPDELVEKFSIALLHCINTIRNEYSTFNEITNVSLNRGISVSFTFYESEERYKDNIKEYQRVESINALVPLVQKAFKVFTDNNDRHVRNMRRERIKRQLTELQDELTKLGEEENEQL
ncbi:hypothetical protein XaC1_241 [Xanthomonas phage XaC1]|nr:hypothetical protein XaC1_241 [Xanthomonas phage XaC1]